MDSNITENAPATEVEIFGTVYPVQGRDNSDYLRDLAQQVDRTMREIAGQVKTADPAKIAILAALNLADELSRCRMQQGERGDTEEKVAALAAELTDALES